MNIERLAKVQGALREIEEHGIGEVNIKISEDNKWLLTITKEKKAPTIYAIQDIINSVTDWGFGSVIIRDGEAGCVTEIRKEKI